MEADEALFSVTVLVVVIVAFSRTSNFQGLILFSYAWMGYQVITKGDVAMHMRRSDIECMNVMRSFANPLQIESPSGNAEFALGCVTECLHSGVVFIQRLDILRLKQDVDHRLGLQSGYGSATDMIDLYDLILHDFQDCERFLSECIGPVCIVVDNFDDPFQYRYAVHHCHRQGVRHR